MMTVTDYLEKIEEIYQEQPDYERGHDGSDGKCDCIGMLKGAMRRCGVTPKGMKGSNYAARYTAENFREIGSTKDLQLGEAVFKAIEPGGSGYDLPDEYKPGGANYNGDLRDYSHIGTVTSLNPLVITHMTSPKPLKDTKLGKWKYHGWLPQVEKESPSPDPQPEPQPEPAETTATVWAASGTTVNMRKGPSTSKALVERVPVGSVVVILDYEPDWCQIAYTDRRGATWYGWMMTEFLIIDGQDPDPQPEPAPDTISISLTENQAEELREILHWITGNGQETMAEIHSQIIEQIGRG